MNKYDLGVKCSAVVASCETPEHLAVADRYLKLANVHTLPYGLRARKDLQRLADVMLSKPNEFVQSILDKRAEAAMNLRKERQLKFESRYRRT